MKISVNAGELAAALALAASLSNRPQVIEALKAVLIKGSGDTATITANVLDHAITLMLPATVENTGEVALSAERLAGVTAALPTKATVEISRDENVPVAHVRCGRSRFKFATVPLDWLPPVPKLIDMTGQIELAREEMLTLSRPAVAAAKEQTRFYMTGLFVRDIDADLISVACDGHRLVSLTIPGAAGLSSDRSLNVPASAIKIVNKILTDKNIERVILRRSTTLFEVATAKVSFVSKLIDAEFPDYDRVIPQPSGNNVIVDRDELMLALARADAALEVKGAKAPFSGIIGLTWNADDPVLRLYQRDDIIDDSIAAEVTGTGQTAMQIALLTEILEKALTGKRVKLDSLNGQSAMLITDPDNADLLALQMPCKLPQLSNSEDKENAA